jgi:transcriptional regulator with XRE-family HTH domain
MVRKVRAYTKVGRRIAELGGRQHKIARVLGVSQQTVSKKLRGETAILLSDLETLARHYRVPVSYFVEEEPAPPELVAAWNRVKKAPAPIQELFVLASALPPQAAEKVLAVARVMGKGSGGPDSEAPGEEKPPAGGIAAEDTSPYR